MDQTQDQKAVERLQALLITGFGGDGFPSVLQLTLLWSDLSRLMGLYERQLHDGEELSKMLAALEHRLAATEGQVAGALDVRDRQFAAWLEALSRQKQEGKLDRNGVIRRDANKWFARRLAEWVRAGKHLEDVPGFVAAGTDGQSININVDEHGGGGSGTDEEGGGGGPGTPQYPAGDWRITAISPHLSELEQKVLASCAGIVVQLPYNTAQRAATIRLASLGLINSGFVDDQPTSWATLTGEQLAEALGLKDKKWDT